MGTALMEVPKELGWTTLSLPPLLPPPSSPSSPSPLPLLGLKGSHYQPDTARLYGWRPQKMYGLESV